LPQRSSGALPAQTPRSGTTTSTERQWRRSHAIDDAVLKALASCEPHRDRGEPLLRNPLVIIITAAPYSIWRHLKRRRTEQLLDSLQLDPRGMQRWSAANLVVNNGTTPSCHFSGPSEPYGSPDIPVDGSTSIGATNFLWSAPHRPRCERPAPVTTLKVFNVAPTSSSFRSTTAC